LGSNLHEISEYFYEKDENPICLFQTIKIGKAENVIGEKHNEIARLSFQNSKPGVLFSVFNIFMTGNGRNSGVSFRYPV